MAEQETTYEEAKAEVFSVLGKFYDSMEEEARKELFCEAVADYLEIEQLLHIAEVVTKMDILKKLGIPFTVEAKKNADDPDIKFTNVDVKH